MDRKRALYGGIVIGWLFFVGAALIALWNGYTSPWVTVADVPGGTSGAIVIGVGSLIVVGFVMITLMDYRDHAIWRENGQEVGLRPSDDPGDTVGPKLTGTVDGRPVTTCYDKFQRSSASSSDGSSAVTVKHAFFEAALADSTGEGVVVGRPDRSFFSNKPARFPNSFFDNISETAAEMDEFVAVTSDDLVLVGTSKAAVEAVDSGRSGEALRSIPDLLIASIGTASGVTARVYEARTEDMEGLGKSLLESAQMAQAAQVPGDGATVSVETKSLLRDGDDFREAIEGVVAVADAFEEATARAPASR
ncbi:MAG: hypothetical protein ABEJ31_00290 [Haloarculaceae archaeon]